MRRSVVVLGFVVALAAAVAVLAAAPPRAAAAPPAKWTYALYCNGDNNLNYTWARFTLPALKQIPANDQVNIVAMVDRPGKTGTWLYKISGGVVTTVANFPEKDFGSGATFAWFIKQVSTRFPAQHLAVNAWDHGYGWRYFSWDDTSNDQITMPELQSAITSAGVPIDILAYDACNMGDVEVVHQVAQTHLVDYMVASEEEIDQDGFPYGIALTPLAQDPNRTPTQVVDDLVAGYNRYYRPLRCFNWVSLGGIDVAKVGAATADLQSWVAALKADLPTYRVRYAADLAASIYAWDSWHVDLADFCQHLVADPAITDANLKALSTTVAGDVTGAMLMLRSGSYADEFKGLTLWWGTGGEWSYYKRAYKAQVAFGKDIGWYDFLKDYNPPKVLAAGAAAGAAASAADASAGAAVRRLLRSGRVSLGLPRAPLAAPPTTLVRAHYGITDVAFADVQHGWAVGYDNDTSNAIILRTTDAGAHWRNLSDPAWYAYMFGAVAYTDQNHAWASGTEGWTQSVVAHTNNGGATWTPQSSHTKQYLQSIDFVGSKLGWIAGTWGTFLHTTDGGTHWTKADADAGRADIWSVDFVDPTHGWVAGGDAAGRTGFINGTTDGGETWTLQTTVAGSVLYSVAFNGTTEGWAVGGDPETGADVVLLTTNGGHTWVNAPVSGTVHHWLADVVPSLSGSAWVVGDQGTALHITDGGQDWAASGPVTTEDLTAAAFPDPNNGWIVGDCEQLWNTTDGGQHWTTTVADVTPPKVTVGKKTIVVKRGGRVAIPYTITDDLSATAAVTAEVTPPGGKASVKSLGSQAVGGPLNWSFHCTWPRGRYVVSLRAVDESGNPSRWSRAVTIVVK